VFGNYADFGTVLTQILLGISCMYVFITRLNGTLKLHKLWYLLLAFIIASPYLYSLDLANNYLSEALTYPLYLLAVICFLEFLLTINTKKLWLSLPILIVLILTRSQFLFMIPVVILILLWLIIKQRNIKKHGWIVLAFMILPFFTSLADKTYHHIKHGYFINTPWTGIHLITPAFYVADEEDYQLFESEKEQEFYKWIYTKLYYNYLNIHNLREQRYYDDVSFYITHYVDIANATLYYSGKEILDPGLNENQKFIALDTLTKKMTLPLIIDNFRPWFNLYIKNSIHAFGNGKYALLYVLFLVLGIFGSIKKGYEDYKVICLLTLLTFSNVALVATGMHTIKRFTFYNDWILFLIIFIFIDAYLKYRKSNV
jgi:hypothetical protein